MGFLSWQILSYFTILEFRKKLGQSQITDWGMCQRIQSDK